MRVDPRQILDTRMLKINTRILLELTVITSMHVNHLSFTQLWTDYDVILSVLKPTQITMKKSQLRLKKLKKISL